MTNRLIKAIERVICECPIARRHSTARPRRRYTLVTAFPKCGWWWGRSDVTLRFAATPIRSEGIIRPGCMREGALAPLLLPEAEIQLNELFIGRRAKSSSRNG